MIYYSKRKLTFYNRFGKPQKISDQETFYQLEYIDPVSKPLAEFRFKYRSREVLQQMMVGALLFLCALTIDFRLSKDIQEKLTVELRYFPETGD